MKDTYIKEFTRIEPNNPILVEGFPGLGLVGKIAIRYLIKKLNAKKFAYLYSPHFPYFVLVNKKGSVRLLRGAFYFWKNENGPNDLILFTGDSQSQTIEGQYEIADRMLDFSQTHNVKKIVTIGGYRTEKKKKTNIFVSPPTQEILNRDFFARAVLNNPGRPIVGPAGLIFLFLPSRKKK